ncbi:hypothetical protein F4813DRAFT_392758 [Daldinia decipiens]|uniref:uncharacterized protein n=1 Tax=Daldinia decipiens TaxID=326647 RepID=UPI0020C1EFFB|nr:uncharacterized protein F4813DRAFT_392758 [Daldinia decipiens]KAI1654254.1 hypothetical protein F4813DRAFT_392758 [Daldinia decipiens]
MDKIDKLPDIIIIDEEDIDDLVEAISKLECDLMAYPGNRGPLSSEEENAVDGHLYVIGLAHNSLMDAKTQEEKKASPSCTSLLKIELACKKLKVIEIHFEKIKGWNSRVKAALGID